MEMCVDKYKNHSNSVVNV